MQLYMQYIGQKGLYIIQYTVYIYVIVHELVYVLYIYKYVYKFKLFSGKIFSIFVLLKTKFFQT